MKKILIALTFLTVLASCKQETAEIRIVHNEKTDRLDSLYSKHYEKGEFNGNVLIAEKGNIIFQESFGVANEKTRELLNTETSFELASVSKQFTAMGIVQLQKEGKLTYDDTISKYISELKHYNNITIKNLLTHTGGLPDYMNLLDEHWDKTNFATNRDVIKLYQELEPKAEFKPGERYRYSNTGYLLLATIIERVSGKSYGEYLNEKIFDPLNMKNTFVYQRRYQPKKISNSALGYIYSDSLKSKILPDEKGKDFYYIYLDGIVGDGMVNSNLKDLLKWDRALYDTILVNNKDKKQIFKSYETQNGNETNYGFGWQIRKDSLAGKIVRHTGRWGGFIAIYEKHIDTDKTIIQLVNNDEKITTIPTKNVRNILYNQKIKTPFSLPKETLLKYAGIYESENGDDKIDYEFGRLWVHNQFELKPISKTEFFVSGFSPRVTYEFMSDDKGNTVKLRIKQPEQGVDITKLKK